MWNEPTKEQLDEIPGLYETENIPLMEKLIYLHFFIFGCDWYIAEYDKDDDTFFGFVILNQDYQSAEWGYISFQDLRHLKIWGVEVDREIDWKPCTAAEIDKIKKCFDFKNMKN